MSMQPTIDIERLRKLAQDGLTQSEIARALGVSNATVITHRARHGIEIRGTRKRSIREKDRVVPKWVPNDLRQDYIDQSKLYGEEAAASAIRKLKAEAARC